ncbi:MAG: nucleotidyltransferase domain-containing protein [Candidatus Hydrothermarchaeota archaeon]
MSVKVFKLDNEELIIKLKSWAESLSRNRDVVGIILFGSLAKKEATPASDVDIVILLKDSKERFDDRIPRFLPEKLGLSVDVFPYTIEEFHSSLKENWGVAKEALESGILLYGIDASDKTSLHEWFYAFLRE